MRTERPGPEPQPAGSGLIAELAQPNDLVVVKRTWGAFRHTTLDRDLRTRDVTTLVLGGIATNFAVESTARAADEHGYALFLVEDAMTSMDDAAHRFAIDYVFPWLGRVTFTVEVIEWFASDL